MGVFFMQLENYLKIIRSGFKELKKNKTLRILSLDMILTESLVFFLIWTYQIYLEELEFQLIYFGFISAAMTITEIAFTNIVPKLEKKQKNKKRFLQIYTMIPGIGFIFMALIHFTPISIPLILIVIGFGFSRSIIFVTGINKQIETQNRATVLSTVNMMGSLIRAIIYPFIGFFVMWNLYITFIILGIIIAIFSLFSQVKNKYF